MGNKRVFIASLLVLLALTVVACAPAATPTASVPVQVNPTAAPATTVANPTTAPATTAANPTAAPPTLAATQPAQPSANLRVAIPVLPRTLDPNVDSSLVHFKVWHLLYNTLVKVDIQGEAQPDLAVSWRIVEPTVWEFKLRPGVKFHNGESFDADAVSATIKYIKDPATKSTWAQRLQLVSDVKVVDPLTVQIITSKPFPLLAKTLAVAFILPPKYLAETGAAKFGLAPVGTGPFKFTSFRADDSANFQAFADYWGPKPQVGSILMRQVAEASSRIAALEAGEIDLAYELPVEQVDRLRSEGLNVVNSYVGASYLATLRTSVKPFDDTRVRQAMNYATDAEAINKALFFGLSRVLQGQTVGPNATGYFDDIKAYPYDPNKARQLLTDAGYPNGFTVKYETSNGRFYKDKEISETLCSQWSKVGVTCDLVLLESNVWLSRLSDATLGPITVAPWQTAPQLDVEVPMTNFVSSSPRKLGNIPKLDALFTQEQTTMDPDQRLKVLHEFAQAIHDDPPVIFLFENVGIYGMSSKVQGATFGPDYAFDPLTIALAK
ncbi:ABC transporter substrate-binding protein [Petrachloros mirabilis]